MRPATSDSYALLGLDLNLLYVLVALDEKRSVSAAALFLRKSQPSVSAGLGKLRDFFNDPLFVRSSNHMQPTPRAALLVASARAVLCRIGSDMMALPTFEPSTNNQPITVALSDVSEIIFLPAILRELQRVAPKVEVRSVSPNAMDVANGLEVGAIDLAIGCFPALKKHNFFQQALLSDTFASVVRADHPMSENKLSLMQYLQLQHVVVRGENHYEEVIERYLAGKHVRRQVALTTPHSTSAPIIVAQSDLIATIPLRLARYFVNVSKSVRLVELPFASPAVELKQFWHRKFHSDERSRWLRTLVCRLFQAPKRRQR